MREISRFFGIIIRMYAEPGAPHSIPHFRAYYQEDVLIYDIASIEVIEGSVRKRQQSLVEAWAELHRNELLTNWQRLQAGQMPLPVAPPKLRGNNGSPNLSSLFV